MITHSRGLLLGTILYGSLLALSMFLLGQLLPVFYVLLSEGVGSVTLLVS